MPLILGRRSYTASQPRIPFDGDVFVGRYTSIAAGCLFLCGSGANHPPAFNPEAVANFNFGEHGTSAGPISIGADVWICSRVTVLGGVHIGHGAIVGAAAVVTKDIPPYAVALGVPAQVKRFRFDPATIEQLLAVRWWDWTEVEVEAARPLFEDVGKFLEKYGGSTTWR